MLTKIILAGGSGYLGQVLSDYYKDKASEIIVLTRNKSQRKGRINFVHWDARTKGAWSTHLEGAGLLINLTGKNVNCRYTERNRREILQSRLEPTALLGSVISELADPPPVWIQLASATIYRHAEDHSQDEETGEEGNGFSVDVCRAWEKSFREANTPFTKKILLRVGIVFGRKDGVLPRLKKLVQFGLGGHQGTGNQRVSWIHEQDLARLTEWLVTHGEDGALYNATAPDAVTNHQLMKLLRQAYGMPFYVNSPQWLLEMGAGLIGTETELVLKSRWVYPGRLLKKGFTFHFPLAKDAVHELLSCRI